MLLPPPPALCSCAAVEEKLVGGLVEAAEAAAASGRGVLATIGVGDTLALSRYYLYGTGRNATEVVADVTGWDVWQLLGQANATVARLQEVRSFQALRAHLRWPCRVAECGPGCAACLP